MPQQNREGRPSTVTDDLRQSVYADLDAGMTQRAIGAKYGIHYQIVGRLHRERHGWEAEDRENNLTEAELEAMIAEQYPTMPDLENDWSGCNGPRLPQAVQRGMGVRASRNTRREMR